MRSHAEHGDEENAEYKNDENAGHGNEENEEKNACRGLRSSGNMV